MPKIKQDKNMEKHCHHCSALMKRRALQKNKSCNNCEKFIAIRNGSERGILDRCHECDSLLSSQFNFCEHCGIETLEHIKRRNRIEKANKLSMEYKSQNSTSSFKPELHSSFVSPPNQEDEDLFTLSCNDLQHLDEIEAENSAGPCQDSQIQLNSAEINDTDGLVGSDPASEADGPGSEYAPFQFPVTPACALTIHKSQGGTFKEIVFNYDKSQEQQLVYVGLSRVTSLDGLYLTNNKNDFKFYHGKGSTVPKITELRSELRRLNNHRLETISDLTRSFITNRTANGFVLMSHNIQSLKAHSMDMTSDAVMQMAELIALSETWTDNDETVNVNGFHCVTQSRRSGHRAGGVAIYQSNATSIEAHPHKVKKVGLEINDEYGDICAAEIILNNSKLILFSVYIAPNTSTANTHLFLLRNLEAYAPNASCSEIDMPSIPMILCGDFNLDVAKNKNKQFIQFIKDKFNMDLYSGHASTTFGDSCLDMVFAKHINGLLCKRFISYYSYHLPIFVIA